MSRTIYVEGGGRAASRACRRDFGKFFEKAGVARRPHIVVCGGRGDAYRKFRGAQAGQDQIAMLLVDAEGPVAAGGPWRHLEASGRWSRPGGAVDEQCHLMVEVMESWFLADPDAVSSFYGRGFRTQALPANPDIERVPKRDVLDGLAAATRGAKKGGYKKGTDGFQILARLDPGKVRRASPHADRLLRSLGAP